MRLALVTPYRQKHSFTYKTRLITMMSQPNCFDVVVVVVVDDVVVVNIVFVFLDVM